MLCLRLLPRLWEGPGGLGLRWLPLLLQVVGQTFGLIAIGL